MRLASDDDGKRSISPGGAHAGLIVRCARPADNELLMTEYRAQVSPKVKRMREERDHRTRQFDMRFCWSEDFLLERLRQMAEEQEAETESPAR